MVLIRILYVTHSSKKGGAEQSMIHLINQTNLNRYRLYILCPPNTEYLDEIKVPVELISMNLNSVKRSFGIVYLYKLIKIKRIIIKNKINIIHANGWRAPWYIAPMKYLSNCKIIWHHRDVMNSRLYNNFLPIFFDNVICISKYVKNTLTKKSERNYSVIYNGVEVEKNVYLKKDKKKNGVFVISSVGRIVEWKRFDYIIKAVKIFSDRIKSRNWIFQIIGDVSVDGSKKYLESLKKMVNDYNLSDNIKFLGYQKRPSEFMKDSDLTINFSDREPFGRVIIESLIVGTPVVVANSGGAPEIIKLTNGGWICNDGDIEDLASTIESIYNLDNNVYQNIVKSGIEGVIKNFDMKIIYNQVENIYQRLLLGK